ncbi:MAG: putative porin [candidate division Zixibacteria bacterium]|nr:putative porin [candidate division Zixibacteria bacterium]MDD5425636.1 putative porin [candidate division Zixibacteria bacterium]
MKKMLIVLTSLTLLSPLAVAENWWEQAKLKGDLRYRHEVLKEGEQDARHRHRLRARFGIEGKVSSTTTIGIQLATGSSDPISTNQTLTGGFSSKSIILDLAYFDFKPAGLPGLKITAGKIHNPFLKPGKSELLWDSDLNPEGGAAIFERNLDNVSITLIGSGLWIEERSKSDDSWLGAGQGVFRYNINEKKSNVAIGAGFFNYVNGKGLTPFYDGEPMGNSVTPVIVSINEDTDDTTYAEVYTNDYEIVELFAEATHHFKKIPVTIMFDYVKNTATDSLNTGWLAGLHIGKTKKPWSWTVRYIYRKVESDAVVGTFTDSDFRGGGTGAKGHEIGGSLILAENTSFDISYFINKIGLDKEEEDFKRLQVDLQLKF